MEGGWELRLPIPDLDCLEYLFDAGGDLAPDPGNPDQVEGAFGPHSFLAMPGYRAAGLARRRAARRRAAPAAPSAASTSRCGSPGPAGPLPLLLVHDGAEMDAFGAVVQYAATRPPMRVALLSPGSNRDERYAANPAYAAALVDEVLPALTDGLRDQRTSRCCSARASAALAALHAAWTAPGTFGGLMLQSGSFFTAELDPQESGYAHFDDGDRLRGVTVHASHRAAPVGSRRWR